MGKKVEVTSEGLVVCPHCGTVMIKDRFFTEQGSYRGFRCLLCGEVVDSIILKNRKNPFVKIKKHFKPVKYA